jgi:hypothetical protein
MPRGHYNSELLRSSLTQTALTERSLVEALGDTLNRYDQQLLQDIQNIATEHEARRGAILNELQTLAAGMFQPAHEMVVYRRRLPISF